MNAKSNRKSQSIQTAARSAASLASQIAALDGALDCEAAAHHRRQADDVGMLLDLHGLAATPALHALVSHALERGASR